MSFDSKKYWVNRYKKGGHSGAGSEGRLAEFKAEVINDFVLKNGIESIVELGVGDGRQLSIANYPKYIGLDVSNEAINLCKETFHMDDSKRFVHLTRFNKLLFFNSWVSNTALSLDVIYHLVEDNVFEEYMRDLFKLAKKYVIIYSSNRELEVNSEHVKDRKFTDWISMNAKEWSLLKVINNPYPWNDNSDDPMRCSRSDFYIYKK